MRAIRRVALAIGAAAISLAAYVGYQVAFSVWWQSPERIEHYLLRETPLGSSQDSVVLWLTSRGADAEIVQADVSAKRAYPLSSAEGTALIQSVLYQHKIPFVYYFGPGLLREHVVAFYVFDKAGALVSLRVRRERDSL